MELDNLTTNVQQVHETQGSSKYFNDFKLILYQWQNSDLLVWLQRIHFWHCLLNKQPYINCDSFYHHSCDSHKVFLTLIFFSFTCSLTQGWWTQVADRKQALRKSTTTLRTRIPLIKVAPKLNFKLGKI